MHVCTVRLSELFSVKSFCTELSICDNVLTIDNYCQHTKDIILTVTSLHDFCIKTCTESFPLYTLGLYCNFICVLSDVILKTMMMMMMMMMMPCTSFTELSTRQQRETLAWCHETYLACCEVCLGNTRALVAAVTRRPHLQFCIL